MKKSKNLFMMIALVAVAFASCKKDDENPPSGGGSSALSVDRVIRPFFVDYTATWCGPCGQYGGPAFDAVLDQGVEGTLLTAMKAYSTSSTAGMGNPLYSQMTSAFGVAGIPDFWVNNAAVSTSSSAVVNSATTQQNDTAQLVAGVALRKELAGDSMKVTTKVKFFKDGAAGANYSLAVYLVEDQITGYQLVGSTANNSYLHRNVLRGSNTTSYYGASLNNNAAVTSGTEFDNTYSIYLNPAWNKSKLKAIAVIWKNGATPYKVINSNVAK
jgi:hypothetical protein